MKADGWIRDLTNDRLEIFLRVGERKVRASGPADEMSELVSWFEEKSGRAIHSPVLPKRPPRQIPGQLELPTTQGLSLRDATLDAPQPGVENG